MFDQIFYILIPFPCREVLLLSSFSNSFIRLKLNQLIMTYSNQNRSSNFRENDDHVKCIREYLSFPYNELSEVLLTSLK